MLYNPSALQVKHSHDVTVQAIFLLRGLNPDYSRYLFYFLTVLSTHAKKFQALYTFFAGKHQWTNVAKNYGII